MRIITFILLFSILGACSVEEVNIADGNWTRFIYETSDIAALEINSVSNPTVAFRNNFYEVLVDGSFVFSPKEYLDEFDPLLGEVALPLRTGNKFIFGGVDSSGIVPRYGIKLMDDEVEASSYFHDNVEKGIFLQGDQDTFHGLLKSPVYLDSSGNFNTDVQVLEYTNEFGFLDTLSSYKITIADLLPNKSASFAGFIDSDQIFFIIQSWLYRFDVLNQSVLSINTGSTLQNIFLLGDQIVVNKAGYKLEIYNRGLVKQDDIQLEGIFTEENVKNTLLKIFVREDQIFLVVGVSKIREVQNNFSEEISKSVDLLAIDNSWNVADTYTILEGLDSNEEVLWQKYELISEDVRTGNFGVFLFRNSLADSKYEYLIKRVNLN